MGCFHATMLCPIAVPIAVEVVVLRVDAADLSSIVYELDRLQKAVRHAAVAGDEVFHGRLCVDADCG